MEFSSESEREWYMKALETSEPFLVSGTDEAIEEPYYRDEEYEAYHDNY